MSDPRYEAIGALFSLSHFSPASATFLLTLSGVPRDALRVGERSGLAWASPIWCW